MKLTKSISIIAFLCLLCNDMSLFGQSLQVMTYNIKYDDPKDETNNWLKRRNDMVNMVNRYQPDILGVQEALVHQMTYLDSCLFNHKYIGVGRDDGKQKGEYCGILYNQSKFDVSNINTFWLSEDTNNPSVGWDASFPRICTYGRFTDKISQSSFWVFNTHFDHKGFEARLNSAGKILEWISILNHESLPVLLMGDLNSYPDSEAIGFVKEFLDDSRTISLSNPEGPEGTFNGFTPNIDNARIDYIFTKDFIIQTYKHIIDILPSGLQISDHQPVFAMIQFYER